MFLRQQRQQNIDKASKIGRLSLLTQNNKNGGYMNHYYSLSEKRDFIDADFKESKLYNMGILPQDPAEHMTYYRQAVEYAKEFLYKYSSKGWSTEYVTEILNDWFSNIEKLMREKGNETNTRTG